LLKRCLTGKHYEQDVFSKTMVPKKMKLYELSEKDTNELTLFTRVAAFLHPEISSPKEIIEPAVNLVKPHLRIPFKEVDKSLVRSWVSDEELNRKAYNRLSLVLIKLILSQDGFRIVSANISQFDGSHLSGYDEMEGLTMPQGLAEGSDFVAENDKGNRIIFCLYDESKADTLKRIATGVFHEDDKFRNICYLVISNQKEMINCRRVDWADKWPRGFFVEFSRLLEKAKEIDETRFGHIAVIPPKTDLNFRVDNKIEHFKAKVLENIPIGGNGDPKHFIIRFQAPELKYVAPGQFVMVDTLPYQKRKDIVERRPIRSLSTSKNGFYHDDIIDLSPKSFLKRPFSIHRSFYKNFEWNSLKDMSLPPTLASITHTVFPHKFEILYKLVENGTGTNELKQMKKGDAFQILGPLGIRPNLAKWQKDGIEEVHLIGGGVGMAPLLFFGQALRYYSFRVKAFIGIDRIESLLFKAPLTSTFGEDDTRNAYVYIDNLKRIGLSDNDIYISFEKTISDNSTDTGLPGPNFFPGLVSEQYKAFLDRLDGTSGILVLTCGPKPMLKALEKITSEANIRMKVLLEKRMGCGIGVCMSCVCPTKKNNVEQYSRVCMEGPLFNSEDIDWEKL